jgi:hypothetical protein
MSRAIMIIIAILGIAIIAYAIFTVASAMSIPFSDGITSAISTPPSYEVFIPSVLDLGQPILPTPMPPGNPAAATGLHSEVDCEVPGKAIVKLSWKIASIPGSAQRVDVTIYSFDEDKFDSSELLPPDQSSFVWDRLRGQAIHDWRVLTLHPEGWVSSETAGFEGPTCVGDFEPTQPPIP